MNYPKLTNAINANSNEIFNIAEKSISGFMLGAQPFDSIKSKNGVFNQLFMGVPTEEDLAHFSRKGSKRKRREKWNHQFKYPQKRHCGFTFKRDSDFVNKKEKLSILIEDLEWYFKYTNLSQIQMLEYEEKEVFLERYRFNQEKLVALKEKLKKIILTHKAKTHRSKSRVKISRKEDNYNRRVMSADCVSFDLEELEPLCVKSTEEHNEPMGVWSSNLEPLPVRESIPSEPEEVILSEEEILNLNVIDEEEIGNDYVDEILWGYYEKFHDNQGGIHSPKLFLNLDEQESIRVFMVPNRAYEGVWRSDIEEDKKDKPELPLLSHKRASILISKEPDYAKMFPS